MASGPELSPYISDLERFAINSKNAEVDLDLRLQIVIFLLGEEYFALPGANVREILNEEKINFIPGVPPSILGIINIRGNVESVIDLKSILELNTAENPSEDSGKKILIARSGEYLCGIIVDELIDVSEILENSIHPVEGALKRSFRDLVSSEFTFRSKLVFILDMDKVMQRVIL